MTTLTIQVPEEIASAAALFDGVEVDRYAAGETIESIIRTVLLRVGLEVHGMGETAGMPEPAELRSLATQLSNCADALEEVA